MVHRRKKWPNTYRFRMFSSVRYSLARSFGTSSKPVQVGEGANLFRQQETEGRRVGGMMDVQTGFHGRRESPQGNRKRIYERKTNDYENVNDDQVRSYLLYRRRLFQPFEISLLQRQRIGINLFPVQAFLHALFSLHPILSHIAGYLSDSICSFLLFDSFSLLYDPSGLSLQNLANIS